MVKEVYAKPCPFCGRRDVRTLRAPSGMWATICWPEEGDGCGSRTDWQFTSQSAMIRWNTRREPATP